MSGKRNSKDQGKQMDPSVLAVVHCVGAEYRTIVAKVGGGKPQILDSRSFSKSEDSRLRSWLDEHSPGQVLMVVPSSHVICRTCPLPDLPEDQLDQALHLQAEAHLLGAAPMHRLGMSVLAVDEELHPPTGLILAWPESSTLKIPEMDRPTQFAADVSGLAALVMDQYVKVPVVWSDPSNGGICVAFHGANGTSYRATREDADDGAWNEIVRRVVVETAIGAGLDSDALDEMLVGFDARQDGSVDAGSFLPQPLVDGAIERLSGADRDSSWWSTYGIAAGVLLARTSSLSALTVMLQSPPDERPHPIAATCEKLSHTRMAVMLAIAALIVLAFGPMAASGIRLALLKMRHDGLDERLSEIQQIEHQVEMYEVMKREAWPMTKLLSDTFCCAPIAVELESITLAKGDKVKLRGKVAPSGDQIPLDVIGEMKTNMLETDIFADVSYGVTDRDNFTGKYNFSMNADVKDAHHSYRYPEDLDFAVWKHEERHNNIAAPSVRAAAGENGDVGNSNPQDPGTHVAMGEDDSPTIPSGNQGNEGDAADTDAESSRATERSNGADAPRRGDGVSGGGSLITRGEEDGGPETFTPPDILTQGQIDAMDEQETREMIAAISKARSYYSKQQNEEMVDVYKEQFRLVLDHLKEVRGQ